jgi:predicted nucleotidyltransferase
MTASWAITPEKVLAVVARIVETAAPAKVILFGSYTRGTLHPHSDLDIMVVMNDNSVHPRKESVRIRRALKGIMMPMDIVVVSLEKLAEYSETPGLIYREALRTGRIVYDAP